MSNAIYELSIGDDDSTTYSDRKEAKAAFEEAVRDGGDSAITLREIKVIGRAVPGMKVDLKPRSERKSSGNSSD